MKQLLLRVPEDLHRRLALRAGREGRSMNAVATEILGAVPGRAGTTPKNPESSAGLANRVKSPASAHSPAAVSVSIPRKQRSLATIWE
jgi:plasmid stability protein